MARDALCEEKKFHSRVAHHTVPNVNNQVRLPKVKDESFCISSQAIAVAFLHGKKARKEKNVDHAVANCYLQDPDGVVCEKRL